MKHSVAADMRRHLIDGKLPPSWQLPVEKPAPAKKLTEKQTAALCRSIVRAVFRPAALRLRFNAAERRLKTLAAAVPCAQAAEALTAAFRARKLSAHAESFGQFVKQCLEGTQPSAVRCALLLIPLLEAPQPFREQPVPPYLWNLIAREAELLMQHPYFAAEARTALDGMQKAAKQAIEPFRKNTERTSV